MTQVHQGLGIGPCAHNASLSFIMTSPAAQTIGPELYEETNAFLRSTDPISEFDLRRLRKAVERLAPVDPGVAAQVRANLEALRWNSRAMHTEFQLALAMTKDPQVFANAAVASGYLNEFKEAVAYARSAADAAPTNSGFANTYFAMLLQHGSLFEALRFSAESPISQQQLDYARSLQPVAEALKFFGISDDRLRRELALAAGVLTAHRRRLRGITYDMERDPENGHSSARAVLFFHGVVEDETDFADALVARLVEHDDWDPSQFLIQFQVLSTDPEESDEHEFI